MSVLPSRWMAFDISKRLLVGSTASSISVARAGHNSNMTTSSSAAKASFSLRYSATTPTTCPAVHQRQCQCGRKNGRCASSREYPGSTAGLPFRIGLPTSATHPSKPSPSGTASPTSPRDRPRRANFARTMFSSHPQSAMASYATTRWTRMRCHRQGLVPMQRADARGRHIRERFFFFPVSGAGMRDRVRGSSGGHDVSASKPAAGAPPRVILMSTESDGWGARWVDLCARFQLAITRREARTTAGSNAVPASEATRP